ncbi:MAG: serine hydrolase domain-containing protein, partial [Vulcanimicrobiaceae bacterium]
MKKQQLAFAAGVFALGVASQPVGAAPAVPSAVIAQAVRQVLSASKTPGVTIAIAEHGQLVYARGFGLRNVARKKPANAQTRYQIGSMTKQFTAAAILQLRDAGKLSLHEKVSQILPNAPHAKQITIYELLTHTSGLANYTNVSGFERMAGKPGSYQQMMALIAKKPLEFTPGSRWRYSNTNYIILGRIIEVLSHEPYERYVQQHEFAPAGMVHTGWIGGKPALRDTAQGYRVAKNGQILSALPLRASWAWSAGAIVSTVGDFVRWTDALRSGKIVPVRDYAEMTTPVRPTYGSSSGYGFGLVRDRFEGQPRVWHNGGTFGFISNGARFPAQHLQIVAFTNSANGPAAAIVSRVFN